MDFFEKVKGFLLEPSKTFDAAKDEKLEEVIKYYAVIAAIYSAIFAVLLVFVGTLFGTGIEAGGAIIFFVLFMIFATVGAVISGAILHIFVYLVGGRKGIAETIKVVMYGSTPGLLLGLISIIGLIAIISGIIAIPEVLPWIRIIGFIAGIWSFVLQILGIRQLHDLTTGKAVLAVILLIIAAVIAAFVFSMEVPPTSYGGGY